MKTNRRFLKFIALLFACLVFFTFSVDAQKRKPAAKKSAAEATTAALTASEIRAGAEKVSVQIKNVTKFIYVLGSVARVIEDLDRDIAAGKTSRNAVDLNTKNKQSVVMTIKNLHAGFVALEIEFRTKPALRNYLYQIQGISDISGNAEDQAENGQFVDSGKTLLLVVEKLADTLVALP